MKLLSRETCEFFGNTEVWKVLPRELRQQYRLLVTTEHYPTAGRPTCGLIAVDGDLHAGTVASAVNSMMLADEVPSTVVVSIAFPRGAPRDWLALRYRDLTPTRVRTHEKAVTALEQGVVCSPTGGANEFLEFIEGEVKPAIQDAHGVEPGEWALSGNSLGGLLVLHALISRPYSYRRYLSISPSAWWQRPLMFDRAREFASGRDPLDGALFVAVGAEETRARFREFLRGKPKSLRKKIIDGIGELDMVGDACEIAGILRKRPGLRVKFKVMQGETHCSVYGVALSQGLRWLHHATGCHP